MKPELYKRLCCPKCKGRLQAEAFEACKDEEIRTGLLLCGSCRFRFPIVNHIPVLLLFRTAFHSMFDNKYGDQLKTWHEYAWPDEPTLPGEKTVQETFTEEWEPIRAEEDVLNFTYTREDLVLLNRDVWLKWIKNSHDRIADALIIGYGSGMEAIALGDLMPSTELFAVDINLSVLQAGHDLPLRDRLHLTICSLFHLPFKEASFDLVYSQGVLHHNYSTREAFRSVARYVRPRGRMFVWVYGLDDHLIHKGWVGLVARASRYTELALRPIVSRAPRLARDAFFYTITLLLHPLVLTRVRHRKNWRLKNTNHGLRDWLSPRYAHTHSYNEVIEWFERDGFQIIDTQSPGAYWDLFGKKLWGVGMTGLKSEQERQKQS